MAHPHPDVPPSPSAEADVAPSTPDAVVSAPPGGPGQIEQEPARGRRLIANAELRPDMEVDASLRQQLAAADDIDSSELELIVSAGVVTLLGTTSDYESKRRIEALCEATPGVREIRDQLRVQAEHAYGGAGGLRTEMPRGGRKQSSD